MNTCVCGCGIEISDGRYFVTHHNLKFCKRTKGFHHSEKTKALWSLQRKGRSNWKKGLTKETDPRIKSSWNKGLPARNKGVKGSTRRKDGAPPNIPEHVRLAAAERARARNKTYIGEANPFFGRKHSEEFKKYMSEQLKRRWLNPEWAKKWAVAEKRGFFNKNKSEAKLEEVINNLNIGFTYVGNGKRVVAGKIPDFINMNSKKIIELYGDYWHKGQDPQDRISLFKQHGFDALIVWEKELKDLDVLSNKIILFSSNLGGK